MVFVSDDEWERLNQQVRVGGSAPPVQDFRAAPQAYTPPPPSPMVQDFGPGPMVAPPPVMAAPYTSGFGPPLAAPVVAAPPPPATFTYNLQAPYVVEPPPMLDAFSQPAVNAFTYNIQPPLPDWQPAPRAPAIANPFQPPDNAFTYNLAPPNAGLLDPLSLAAAQAAENSTLYYRDNPYFASGDVSDVGAFPGQALDYGMRPFDFVAEVGADITPFALKTLPLTAPFAWGYEGLEDLSDRVGGPNLPELPGAVSSLGRTYEDIRDPGQAIKDFRSRPIGEQFLAGAVFDPLNAVPIGKADDIARGVRYAADVAPDVARQAGRLPGQAVDAAVRLDSLINEPVRPGVGQAVTEPMVFGKGRVKGTPARTVIPDSTEDYVYLSGGPPPAPNDPDYAVKNKAWLEAVASRKKTKQPQPLARERLWFHSTNDMTFDLPDPDLAVGQSTGITQGPGIYMAADPAKSAGRYGSRTFVSEFDGNVLDLTAEADQALWGRVRQAVAERLKKPLEEFDHVDADTGRRRFRAELGTATNNYGYRDQLVDDIAEMIRREGIPGGVAGRFEGVMAKGARADNGYSLAIVNDALAANGVDALFHHSPRADGDVLIVLNGEAARVVTEGRNLADAMKAGSTLQDIKRAGVRDVVRAAERRRTAQIPPSGLEVVQLPNGWSSVQHRGSEIGNFRRVETGPNLGAVHYSWLRGEGLAKTEREALEQIQQGVQSIRYSDLPPSRTLRTFGERPLTTDLVPGPGGATDELGMGLPKIAGRGRHADPTEVINGFIPNEKPATGVVRQYEGRLSTFNLEASEQWEAGNRKLLQSGIGKRAPGGLVKVERTPEVEDLYRALHGELDPERLTERMRPIYDEIKELVEIEAKATADFDPHFIMREDYFYRGWRAPRETRPGSATIGGTPGFKKPRVEATFDEMLADGFEPTSWNAYDMLTLRRFAGVQHREQQTLIQRLKDLGIAIQPDGPLPDGYRVPRVGPAFEGKPFAFIPQSEEAVGAMVGFTKPWAVPHEVADILENMAGKGGTPIMVGPVDLRKVLRGGAVGVKRAKLIASLFQHVDFATRTGAAAMAGSVDALLHGRPDQAVIRLARVPQALGKFAWAVGRSNRQSALRRQILSGKPIVAERPNLSLRLVAESGWKHTDQSIGIKNQLGKDVKGMLDDILKEDSPLAVKLGTAPFRRAQMVSRAWERGLFDGGYPQAQIEALRNFIIPNLVRRHKDWTDAQIAGEAAAQVNKMFSTLGEWQTFFKNPSMRAFMHNILFSTNEQEALIRQALSTVTGPNKQMWLTYYAGAALFLGGIANAVHFAATGEHLPLDRYQPIEKDENAPFGLKYNSRFMSPNIPGLKGRHGTQLSLDLMGQMDTIFRTLDPKMFIDSRLSVPVRAALNQYTGEDFYGRPLETRQERLGQLVDDLLTPIGAGNVIGALGLGPENEARLGSGGQLFQSSGLNLRAETNAQLRDRVAKEMFGRGYYDLEPAERKQVRDSEAVGPEVLQRRTETVDSSELSRQQASQDSITQRRLADEAKAVAEYEQTKNGGAFRSQVSEIQKVAAIERAQANREYQEFKGGKLPSDPVVRAGYEALDQYYSLFEREELRQPGRDLDFDRFEAALAELEKTWTPEQKAFVERNTGLAEHHPVVQELYDDRKVIRESGYWELSDALAVRFGELLNLQGVTNQAEFEDALHEWAEEQIRDTAESPEELKHLTAYVEDRIWGKFNTALGAVRLDWRAEHPDIAELLRKWDYLSPRQSIGVLEGAR